MHVFETCTVFNFFGLALAQSYNLSALDLNEDLDRDWLNINQFETKVF